jgi:hypothetical protein
MNKDKRISRRVVLRGAAVAAGAVPVLLAGMNAAEAKASQASVQYKDSPKGDQSCANCRLFEPPAACKSVDGTISPNGWCMIWVKKA